MRYSDAAVFVDLAVGVHWSVVWEPLGVGFLDLVQFTHGAVALALRTLIGMAFTSPPDPLGAPVSWAPGDDHAPGEGRDVVDGEPKDCRSAGKRPSWQAAGEAAFLLLRIAAGVAALYGALKGGGLV